MLVAFIHGYALAFGLILPLGPQNAFVFSQGAARMRWTHLLPVILAASLADTTLILLAVLGVSVIVLTLPWLQTVLLAAGITFLAYVGWLTWRSDPAAQTEDPTRKDWSLRDKILFTLGVSLLNPHAIMDTIGVIGTSALNYTDSAKLAFTAACILNSWLWFVLLAVAGRFLGTIGTVRHWLNRASAVVMWSSAAYLMVGLFK
jgi:L-lysine exporter family protein LysE/ArgO